MGGGGSTQTTNQNSQSLQDTLNQLLTTSGSLVSGNELSSLTGSPDGSGTGGSLGFYTNEMNNGLDPAVTNLANANYNASSEQGINDAIANATPGTNTAGLTEDLQKQQVMGQAQLGSNLAAANQQTKQQGAAGVNTTAAQANPLTNFSAVNSTGTTSASGTQNSTTNTQTQPSFGSLLGSLLGAYAGIATGGAAGAGGLGSILGGL